MRREKKKGVAQKCFPVIKRCSECLRWEVKLCFFKKKKKSKYCGLWQERLKCYGITIAPFGGRGKKYIYTCTWNIQIRWFVLNRMLAFFNCISTFSKPKFKNPETSFVHPLFGFSPILSAWPQWVMRLLARAQPRFSSLLTDPVNKDLLCHQSGWIYRVAHLGISSWEFSNLKRKTLFWLK